jgi:LAO/AO transport system kinase
MVINRNSSRRKDGESDWYPPILQTVALDGSGIAQVVEAIAAHRDHLHTSGLWLSREQARVETELLTVLQQELLERLLAQVGEEQIQTWVERIAARETDVYSVVQEISS